MAISKVIYGENILIDLTNDTVTSDTLAAGITAHNSAGESVVGTVTMLSVDEIAQLAAQKVDKESLGISNVDNTSDADKPVSAAQQAALAEKAPAGYGFGEPAEIAEVGSEEELFAFLEQMFQKCQEAGAKKVYIYARNHIGSIPATSCFMGNVYKFGTMVGGFTGYSYINGFAEISIQRYNTWKAIEWSNPPMFPGVEYRTTERWNGKAVYTQLVNFGACPLSSSKSLEVKIGSKNKPTMVVDISGVLFESGGIYENIDGASGVSVGYSFGEDVYDDWDNLDEEGDPTTVEYGYIKLHVTTTDNTYQYYDVYFTLKYTKD